MKLLTYSLLSALVTLLLVVLFPLVLAAWLVWRAHERRVLTQVIRCDGGEGQPSPTERAENKIDAFLERILTDGKETD